MDIKDRLWLYEGTKEYQTKMNYFRNGKFYPYKDSLGKLTIGCGHLVLKNENFNDGITEKEADILLSRDLANVILEVQSLGLNVPDDWNDFLIIMTFQLGINGVKKFKRMINALQVKNFREAIVQAKDSLWYRQTPNRVDDMIRQLTNK
ncbi:glycoside hydrolase family protein [Phytobacter diazotrophicus]|uniref:glycoside hydrolase family protein n=1 Tax=Phytobacter diazotrophicus TaxID=395631 RepID=UPI0029367EEA|nr:glycoside hydrolase family protein [Phytobacter diazotrophicus]MDV2872427.1 glycoside hydrolase family protein [Phytobacter diazotrophicus]